MTLPQITEQQGIGHNVLAFLYVRAWTELGSDYLKRSDDGYNVIVTGIDGKLELFTDYAAHPFSGGGRWTLRAI